jgi:hypothetical protein
MAELEHELRRLAAELEWPPTPPLALPLAPRRRHERRPLRPLWVVVAAVLVALAVALSVPAARSAILRVFHLGGVTVAQVSVLPPAQEQPLAADLGPPVDADAADAALGMPLRLPKLSGTPKLHLRDGVVSVLLATPQPLLLSEFRSDVFLFKKIAGSRTNVVSVHVGNTPGLWIAGARHVFVLPTAPPRLAGNVLIWQVGTITYRLEGHTLSEKAALKLAAEINGT